ncbi:MAG: DUF5074 domain-containing protein [Aestuariibaculum sp.]
MKHSIKFFAVLTALAFVTFSCKDDDDDIIDALPLGAYENGYFILNEGNSTFTSPVTYVSETGNVSQNIFSTENPNADPIGTYLQDMFFDDTRAFIISGSANTVTVVNRYTFEYITTVSTDFQAPRYGTVVGGKAFVTNSADWSTGTDDFVTVIDLSDYSTSKIAIENNAERILSEDGMVYIANGYYGSGNSITVLNPATNAVETIDLGNGNSPNFIEDENGSLYVLTSNGKVIEINLSNNEIVSTIDLPASIESPKNLDIEDNIAYFTSGSSVYGFALTATTIPETPILTYESTSLYGIMYGFAVEDDKIYISDAGDFASEGTVYEYTLNGTLLKNITTGIAPNSFHFND